MGPQGAHSLWRPCAAALELAFASGELSVGARGWRTRRADLVNRWLTGRSAYSGEDESPCPSRTALGTRLAGPGRRAPDTWLGRISAERIDAWAHGRPGERSRLARALVPRLLEPQALPDDPLPTLRWLLGHADGGCRSPPGTTSRPRWSPRRSTRSAGASGSSAPCARNWTCSRCIPCAG